MLSSKKQEKGQGLVEYALILVLVAVVVLAVLLILGPIIGNVFSDVNSALSTRPEGAVASTDCASEWAAEEAACSEGTAAQCNAAMDATDACMGW